MNAAGLKKPAGGAGFNHERANNSSYNNNISQNLHLVNQTIAKTREKLHLNLQEWQRFSIFCARLALDDAPPEIRQLFLGKPSTTAKNALLLAEVFTVLVVRAEDAATAANTAYAYADIWAKAIELWGGCL